MASSISHDLRHSLAAIVANSEFLCESGLTSAQREELYQEVRSGANLMTDLIDSLLEFARTRESLSPTYGNVNGHRCSAPCRRFACIHATTGGPSTCMATDPVRDGSIPANLSACSTTCC